MKGKEHTESRSETSGGKERVPITTTIGNVRSDASLAGRCWKREETMEFGKDLERVVERQARTVRNGNGGDGNGNGYVSDHRA